MNRRVLFFALSVACLLGFVSACGDDDKQNVYYVWNEPAIAGLHNNVPVIHTSHGTYEAQLKPSTQKGDYLWITSFVLDMNKQVDSKLLKVTNLLYDSIGGDRGRVHPGADYATLFPEYADSIEVAALYGNYVGNVLFFKFEFSRPTKAQYSYVVFYTGEKDRNDNPILRIKVRREAEDHAVSTNVVRYAFDMTDFLEEIGNPATVSLNIMYKVGLEDGKDKYTAFKSNPITWTRPAQ